MSCGCVEAQKQNCPTKLCEYQRDSEDTLLSHYLFLNLGHLVMWREVLLAGTAWSRVRGTKLTDLQSGEEFISILMLSQVQGLPIVVLERFPEASWAVPLPIAERQVCKCGLHSPKAD